VRRVVFRAHVWPGTALPLAAGNACNAVRICRQNFLWFSSSGQNINSFFGGASGAVDRRAAAKSRPRCEKNVISTTLSIFSREWSTPFYPELSLLRLHVKNRTVGSNIGRTKAIAHNILLAVFPPSDLAGSSGDGSRAVSVAGGAKAPKWSRVRIGIRMDEPDARDQQEGGA